MKADNSLMDARSLVDYAASLDCIHCGLCLHACPTYRITGHESSSPRGRVHLMRGVAEGRAAANEAYAQELDFCLVCRSCESACPAGVRFGEMMEFARDALREARPPGRATRWIRWIGFSVLLRSRRWLRAAAWTLWALQRTRLISLFKLFGARASALIYFPSVPDRRERLPLPGFTPAQGGEARASVALLQGCVMPELFGRVNRATVRALAAAGIESRVPTEHVCCGALHAHNGELELARELAHETIEAFESLEDSGKICAVVSNSAGCGAHMKAYGHLLAKEEAWAERAKRFALSVRDLSEVLLEHAPPGGAARLPDRFARPLTYDDPCHLCHGQGIRKEPRALLDRLCGMERAELEDSEQCCGSAGIYALTRPSDAERVFAPRLAALQRSGARTLVTANPGCQIQWQSGLARSGIRVEVVHLAEVLAESYEACCSESGAKT